MPIQAFKHQRQLCDATMVRHEVQHSGGSRQGFAQVDTADSDADHNDEYFISGDDLEINFMLLKVTTSLSAGCPSCQRGHWHLWHQPPQPQPSRRCAHDLHQGSLDGGLLHCCPHLNDSVDYVEDDEFDFTGTHDGRDQTSGLARVAAPSLRVLPSSCDSTHTRL